VDLLYQHSFEIMIQIYYSIKQINKIAWVHPAESSGGIQDKIKDMNKQIFSQVMGYIIIENLKNRVLFISKIKIN